MVLQQNVLKLVEVLQLVALDQAVKRPKSRSCPLSILRMRIAPSLCRMTKNDSCLWILTNCLVSFCFLSLKRERYVIVLFGLFRR